MKSVVFSSSVSNYAAMQPWAEALRAKGIKAELPLMTVKPKDFKKLDMAEQRKQKIQPGTETATCPWQLTFKEQ
jgi:hypothetical protein